MAAYAVSIMPLIRKIGKSSSINQRWYADDANATGDIMTMRAMWDELLRIGPGYGYHVNAKKSRLLVHPENLQEAKSEFAGTGIEITTSGSLVLGSPIGSKS